MATTDTNHAIGLTTSDGIEVLIHIGIDTVEMKGEGFVRLVEQGDAVETGQPLLTFDRDKIKAAGHDDVVIMVVSNTAEFADVKVLESDDVDAGSPLLQVVRK
jgi:glucose-specific phosphotransferase system IIA component